MFSRKKIAAVSALLGGLAVTCAGATQAYAGSPSGDCIRGPMGNKTCIHKHLTAYTTKSGKHVVIKQAQHCSANARDRVVWPDSGLLNRGITRIGPVVDCSNRAPLPKGFKLPHLGL